MDASVALELDPAERELDLPLPTDLDRGVDCSALRLEITRAQKPVARRPEAKPGGGNDQKRIRLTITCDDSRLNLDPMRDFLVRRAAEAGADSPTVAGAATTGATKYRLQQWVWDALAGLVEPAR